MHIFLSHSSKQKPLVREVKRHLPSYLGTWLDEEKLLFGDDISESISTAIKCDTDYVLLFIDENAAISEWVVREIEWTLQAEKEHGRTILLPIVVDEKALRSIPNVEMQNRKYLRLKDYLESSVRALADAIASELFALVCRDMDRLRTPPAKNPGATLSDADALARSQAKLIQKAVFPHRKTNPISRETLREVVNSQSATPIGAAEFEGLLSSVAQRSLIPGLLYDGFELYLVEEHSSWKADIEHSKKERIGRKASSFIANGMKVLLDAGSTVEEVVKVICKKIETRALTRVTIATTSVNSADMISDCCVSMGFDDEFSAVTLYIPGGQVRPNTQAIVPAGDGEHAAQLVWLAEHLGGFDVGFVGVNGIDENSGFTTHGNTEAANKEHILRTSRHRIIVGDSSKIGLILEHRFASLQDDVRLIVDDDPISQRWLSRIGSHSEKVTLA
jgi:DeoR/GlpR family transcriptional regulator of sugar metabolism